MQNESTAIPLVVVAALAGAVLGLSAGHAAAATEPASAVPLELAPSRIVWERRRNHELDAYFDRQSGLYWALPRSGDWQRLANEVDNLARAVELSRSTNQAADRFNNDGSDSADRMQNALRAKADQADEAYHAADRRLAESWEKVNVPGLFLRKGYADARGYIDSLVVQGQGGWRLPLAADVKKANPGYSLFGSPYAFFREPGNDPCGGQAPVYGLTSHKYAACWPMSDGNYFIPVRSPTRFDEVIGSALPDDEKLQRLTRLLLDAKPAAASQAEPVPPAKPALAEPAALQKGEFETSADFGKRMAAEAARVAKLNEGVQRDYDARLQRHEAELAAYRRKQDEIAAREATTEARRARVNEAATRAMNLLYGDPLLSDFRYDADRQVFVGQLRSEKGSFARQIEFPVALRDAPQMKARLLDTRAIPVVSFDVQWPNLIFAKLDVVDNAIKQQMDFAAVKNTHSIEAYQEFIQRNPKAPQVAQAQQGIDAIRRQQEKDRQERLKREREEAAQARAHQQAEEARKQEIVKRGCKDIYPGKTGRISGKVFFLDTVDSYIVRYVNAERRMVTIEGTGNGGGALKYGQMHEISCADLLWSSR
jgi:hypothetical protein